MCRNHNVHYEHKGKSLIIRFLKRLINGFKWQQVQLLRIQSGKTESKNGQEGSNIMQANRCG